MPRSAAEDRSCRLGEPPSQVQVTVVRHPGGLTARSWLAAARRVARRRVILSLAVLLAVAGGTVGAATVIGASSAASGFPLRCVSLTIVLHDPRFLRTAFDRALPCERGRSGPRYVTAGATRSQ